MTYPSNGNGYPPPVPLRPNQHSGWPQNPPAPAASYVGAPAPEVLGTPEPVDMSAAVGRLRQHLRDTLGTELPQRVEDQQRRSGSTVTREARRELAQAILDDAIAVHTELEILAPHHGPAPGVRPRPPNARHEQPAALRVSDPGKSRTQGADDAGPSGQATTTDQFAPSATAGGQTVPVCAPISISVLGGLRVHWTPEPDTDDQRAREITGVLQPKTQELLVLLALHPEGVTREALVAALWGQDPPARPTNALHTALSRMRSTLTTATAGTVRDITLVGNGRYQLDPTTVSVDYWRFADAVAARRAATTDHTRVTAYRDVVNSYGGALAEGMSTEWIEPAREAIRRDAIDAVAALARALVDQDPQQTLDLLEIARAFDPHNELLYRDIMRLQERLGQLDAIPRTLTLLTTRLAEIGGQPTPQARGLATRLHSRDAPAQAAHRHRQPGHRGTSAAS